MCLIRRCTARSHAAKWSDFRAMITSEVSVRQVTNCAESSMSSRKTAEVEVPCYQSLRMPIRTIAVGKWHRNDETDESDSSSGFPCASAGRAGLSCGASLRRRPLSLLRLHIVPPPDLVSSTATLLKTLDPDGCTSHVLRCCEMFASNQPLPIGRRPSSFLASLGPSRFRGSEPFLTT